MDDLKRSLLQKDAQDSADSMMELINESQLYMPDKSLLTGEQGVAAVFLFWREFCKARNVSKEERLALFTWLSKDTWNFLSVFARFMFETGRGKVIADNQKEIAP